MHPRIQNSLNIILWGSIVATGCSADTKKNSPLKETMENSEVLENLPVNREIQLENSQTAKSEHENGTEKKSEPSLKEISPSTPDSTTGGDPAKKSAAPTSGSLVGDISAEVEYEIASQPFSISASPLESPERGTTIYTFEAQDGENVRVECNEHDVYSLGSPILFRISCWLKNAPSDGTQENAAGYLIDPALYTIKISLYSCSGAMLLGTHASLLSGTETSASEATFVNPGTQVVIPKNLISQCSTSQAKLIFSLAHKVTNEVKNYNAILKDYPPVP